MAEQRPCKTHAGQWAGAEAGDRLGNVQGSTGQAVSEVTCSAAES